MYSAYSARANGNIDGLKSSRWALALVAITLAMVSAGCGSGMSHTLSPAQAQAVSQQMVQAVVPAVENAISQSGTLNPPPSLSRGIGELHSDQSSGCTPSGTGENCNFPLSASEPCSEGGTIAVTGDIQGTLSNSGSGSFSSQITLTPTNCKVSNVTFNGDPNISIDGQISFTQTGPTFPIALTESGGISFGPNPSGSCQVNVTYMINSLSSCTVSGMICGRSVNGSC